MPKCPSCEGNIDHLTVKEERTSIFTLEDDCAHYESKDSEDEVDRRSWYCPWCDAYLFGTEEEALEFFGKEVQNGDKS